MSSLSRSSHLLFQLREHLDQAPRYQVSAAVGAVLQLMKKGKEKEVLMEEADEIQIQMSLKKIPQKRKTVKLNLPHALNHPDQEVCLFVKDLDKQDRDYEPTVHHFQSILKKHRITAITEIIPLKSLKTEYKPYESKRNLSNAYDVFLADARIIRLLPTYLGKHFYGRKRAPIQVNLQAKDLQKEITSAIGGCKCEISNRGSSSLASVATSRLSSEKITENVLSSANQLAEAVAGGKDNIKQLNLKTKLSPSIPFYMSEGGPQEVKIVKEGLEKEKVEAEEISTLFGAKIKVHPSGFIEVVKDGEEEKKRPTKRKKFDRKGGVKKGKRVASSKPEKSHQAERGKNKVLKVQKIPKSAKMIKSTNKKTVKTSKITRPKRQRK